MYEGGEALIKLLLLQTYLVGGVSLVMETG